MFTKEQIFEQLKAMGVPQNKPVTTHTSLKRIGDVEGRAAGLLDILIEYVTADGGLLCVPTHTHANLYRDDIITLDFLNLNTNVGKLSEVAMNDKRGVHTVNPSHSMIIFGDRKEAERFAKYDETIKTVTSPEGCYGRLAEEDGYILLMGVGQEKNTFIHCIDEMLQLPDRLSKQDIDTTVRYPDGHIVHFPIRTFVAHMTAVGDVSHRFPKYEPAFRWHGCIQDGMIGNAPAQLCSAKKMAEVARLIYDRSGGIDFLGENREVIDEQYYK